MDVNSEQTRLPSSLDEMVAGQENEMTGDIEVCDTNANEASTTVESDEGKRKQKEEEGYTEQEENVKEFEDENEDRNEERDSLKANEISSATDVEHVRDVNDKSTTLGNLDEQLACDSNETILFPEESEDSLKIVEKEEIVLNISEALSEEGTALDCKSEDDAGLFAQREDLASICERGSEEQRKTEKTEDFSRSEEEVLASRDLEDSVRILVVKEASVDNAEILPNEDYTTPADDNLIKEYPSKTDDDDVHEEVSESRQENLEDILPIRISDNNVTLISPKSSTGSKNYVLTIEGVENQASSSDFIDDPNETINSASSKAKNIETDSKELKISENQSEIAETIERTTSEQTTAARYNMTSHIDDGAVHDLLRRNIDQGSKQGTSGKWCDQDMASETMLEARLDEDVKSRDFNEIKSRPNENADDSTLSVSRDSEDVCEDDVNQNMTSDDQNESGKVDGDFEIISEDSGLPFTNHVQHVHALLLSKGENADGQFGGEQTLIHLLKSRDTKPLKSFLRKNNWGPSHPIRGCLWVQACEYLHKAKGNVYEEFEKELYIQRNVQDPQLPPFVDFDHLTSYHLTQSGVDTVGRILDVIQHTNPDIVYCPMLYPLLSLFLHYMEPSDVYNCAYELLRAKEPFIMQTKVAVEASKAVLRDLTKKFAKSSYVYIVRNSSSVDAVFDRWLWWIFSDLPFPYLVRVIDCYLLEGHKILYRVAIAILIHYTKYSARNGTGSQSGLTESIRQFCSDMPFSVKKLLKKAFGIRGLTRKEIKKLQVKHEMLLKSRNFINHEIVKSMSTHSMGMQLTKSFSGPITLNDHSSILKTDMLYTIWSWLPPRFAVCQPELLYTSEEHGTSLMTLYSRVENHQPTLLFIKTTNDEVFGAFCSTYWRERRRSNKNVSYFGTGETFLFTLAPEKRKYEWVGLTLEDVPNTANMFMAGDSSILTVGGGNGEAIQLDANLLHCRTEHCDTFDNEPLCSQEDFTCKVVEVYGFH